MLTDIHTVEAFRLITLLIWMAVFVSTVPFLVVAARGHQRSTLMTVALLGVLGFILAGFYYDSARTASQMERPVRLWVNYWGGSVISLLMAITLGVRTWKVMLGKEAEAVTQLDTIEHLVNSQSDRQETKIDTLHADITALRDEAVRVSAAALAKAEHQAPIDDSGGDS